MSKYIQVEYAKGVNIIMRKRSHSRGLLVMSLTLLMSVFFCGAAWAAFPDVKTDHWAADIIQTMSDKGVVGGSPDGTFKPNNTVNQVEAVCMAVRAMGLQASSSGTLPQISFPFLKGSSWERYSLNSDVYIHYNSGKTLSKSSLNSGYSVSVYTLWDMVYEIVVE